MIDKKNKNTIFKQYQCIFKSLSQNIRNISQMHRFICFFFCSEFKTKHDSLIRTSTLVYKRSEFATPNFTPESEKWHVVLLLFVIFCIFLLFYLNYVFIHYISMWMWFVFSPGFKSMWHMSFVIFLLCLKKMNTIYNFHLII